MRVELNLFFDSLHLVCESRHRQAHTTQLTSLVGQAQDGSSEFYSITQSSKFPTIWLQISTLQLQVKPGCPIVYQSTLEVRKTISTIYLAFENNSLYSFWIMGNSYQK
jgi:hypothetical protein